MDRRLNLAKKFFIPTASPLETHKHYCSICLQMWTHKSTRCAKKGHRSKICPQCRANNKRRESIDEPRETA